jgi:hypothetical protein
MVCRQVAGRRHRILGPSTCRAASTDLALLRPHLPRAANLDGPRHLLGGLRAMTPASELPHEVPAARQQPAAPAAHTSYTARRGWGRAAIAPTPASARVTEPRGELAGCPLSNAPDCQVHPFLDLANSNPDLHLYPEAQLKGVSRAQMLHRPVSGGVCLSQPSRCGLEDRSAASSCSGTGPSGDGANRDGPPGSPALARQARERRRRRCGPAEDLAGPQQASP